MPEAIHPIDIAVGQRIAAFRMAKGMNQSQLGLALGVSFQQVQKYEKGTNRISASKMYTAAIALDVRIQDFFGGDDDGGSTAAAMLNASPAEKRLLKAIKKLDQREIGALADAAQGLGADR